MIWTLAMAGGDNGQGFTTFPCLWSIIKVPAEPQTPLLFLSPSDVEIHTLHRAKPLSSTLFWAKRCGADEPCLWKHHVSITSKAQETKAEAGSIGQILPLVTAFSFTCIAPRLKEGLFTLEYVHCKGKEEALSTRTQTSGLLCSPSQYPHIKRAQNGLLFHNAPCGTSFFRARTSHSIFPHSYTNSPLIRSEKCDFQHSSLAFFFFSHPYPTLPCPIRSPPAWCWPSQQAPLPPPRPPPTLGRRGPWAELWLELISGAHLEAGWRPAGDRRGPRPLIKRRCDTRRGRGLPPHGAQCRAPSDVQRGHQLSQVDQA